MNTIKDSYIIITFLINLRKTLITFNYIHLILLFIVHVCMYVCKIITFFLIGYLIIYL